MRNLSRRRFVKGTCALSAAWWASTGIRPLAAQPSASPLFEAISPEASGITWRHVNGRSPEYYLPETTGAGCGFIDYDNDGWVDIYLVNSGRCDFFHPDPPLRNALYHNNRDGTFTDVTERAGIRWSVNLKCAPGSSTFGIWQPTHRSFATAHVLLAAPVERGLATA